VALAPARRRLTNCVLERHAPHPTRGRAPRPPPARPPGGMDGRAVRRCCEKVREHCEKGCAQVPARGAVRRAVRKAVRRPVREAALKYCLHARRPRGGQGGQVCLRAVAEGRAVKRCREKVRARCAKGCGLVPVRTAVRRAVRRAVPTPVRRAALKHRLHARRPTGGQDVQGAVRRCCEKVGEHCEQGCAHVPVRGALRRAVRKPVRRPVRKARRPFSFSPCTGIPEYLCLVHVVFVRWCRSPRPGEGA
jgi:hypothetical protein